MIDPAYQKDWERDCLLYHGKILTGHFSHWCYDWDELPIDETCEERPCACANNLVAQHSDQCLGIPLGDTES